MDNGTLYLVATPIGNLGDISLRAIETLKCVDYIAAEDTRQTLKLLTHFNIKKPITSYYEHNKLFKGDMIIKDLLEGKNIALVSDAGTPGISDPGEDIVKSAQEENIKITMIPGASACITALVLSGASAKRFVFEGFLPREATVRKSIYAKWLTEERSIVFYEAPHRIKKTLLELYDVMPNRKITLARELTKIHEEFLYGDAGSLLKYFNDTDPRGEFVVVLHDCPIAKEYKKLTNFDENVSVYNQVSELINGGMTKKDALKHFAQISGLKKNQLYSMFEKEKPDPD